MPTSENRSVPSRGYVLLILTALSAMNQLDRQLMNVLVEPIGREFSLSDVQIGLLAGMAFAAIYTVLSIPAAIYTVKHSRVHLLAASAALWGTMTALCGSAQSFWQFFLARFGVGIGEAGGMPPSHAIISDLYLPTERASAMSIWSAGINVGIFMAFLVGGLIGQFYGWRTAFFVAGGLTLALALLLRLTVPEPRRGSSTRAAHSSTTLLADTVRSMAKDAVLRHVFVGATLASIVGYGMLTWLTSFLVRSHGMNIASAGGYLALVVGAGGAMGSWLTGAATDRFRRRDVRWALWVVALVLLVAKPFSFAFLLVGPTAYALALFVIPGIFGAVFVGPSLAVLHNRVAGELRPIASAVFLLVVNFIGLGLGPLMVGAVSQYGFAGYGMDALRYSLVVSQFVAIWAAFHYYVAGSRLGPEDRHMPRSPASSGC